MKISLRDRNIIARQHHQLTFRCVNCEDLIQEECIDNHSRKCVNLSQEVKSASKEQESQMKLKSLHSTIYQMMQSQTSDRQFVMRAEEICRQLHTAPERQTQDLALEIETMIHQFKGSTAVMVCLDRLHQLCAVQQINKKHKSLSQISTQNYQSSNGRSTFKESIVLDTDRQTERNFYSKCLATKLQNSNSKYIPNIKLSSLFQEVRRKAIPQVKWDLFIKDSLSHRR